MTERSGLDILKELLLEVQTLRKEIKVLDHKIAHIANSAKIAELAGKIRNVPEPKTKPKVEAAAPPVKVQAVDGPNQTGIKQFKFERNDASKTNQTNASRSKRSPKKTFVKGKMVTNIDGKQVLLSDLNVKIFDAKDNVVKETRTNRAGQWMCSLESGKYVVNIEGEYKGNELVPVNIPFEVKEGMKDLEVS